MLYGHLRHLIKLLQANNSSKPTTNTCQYWLPFSATSITIRLFCPQEKEKPLGLASAEGCWCCVFQKEFIDHHHLHVVVSNISANLTYFSVPDLLPIMPRIICSAFCFVRHPWQIRAETAKACNAEVGGKLRNSCFSADFHSLNFENAHLHQEIRKVCRDLVFQNEGCPDS